MKRPSDLLSNYVTEAAGAQAEAASDHLAAVLDQLRAVVPADQQRLILALEDAASAYAVDYGDACFALGVTLALHPEAVLIQEAA